MQRIKRQGIQVFFTAFAFFFIETAFFHILHFTHDNLEATLVISYALLGLALGSLVTYLAYRIRTIHFPLLVLLFIISTVLAFLNITRLPRFVHLSPFMVFPFMMGNIIITYFLRAENSNRMYFYDLSGATCGIFFSVATIPLLKTENALFLCIAVLCIVGFVFTSQYGRSRLMRAALSLLFVIALGTMIANLQWHFLDLERLAEGGGTAPEKDFSSFRRRGMPLLFSRDSLVTRISVYRAAADRTFENYKGDSTSTIYWTCFDGDSNDVIDSAPPYQFRNDPRIPFMYYEDGSQHTLFDEPPKVFIIGASAQGIIKSIKFLVKDPSLIDTVEINPAIVDLMRNELYELSGRAYEDVEVKRIDARAHLKHARERYDLITMMNTYTMHNIGYFGEPDFVHTRDAVERYLDHLNEGGFLLFEERNENERCRYAIFKMLNNCFSALQDRGWREPQKHFFIYSVNTSKSKYRLGWYTFIVVKSTPITEAERAYFLRWLDSRHYIEYVLEQEVAPDMDFTFTYHTQLEYLPGESAATEYSRFMEGNNKLAFFGPEVRLTPTTDMKPYIFDVFTDRKEIKQLIAKMGAVCAGVFCLALLLFFFSPRGKPALSSIPFILYFLLLGVGYFVIEIALMKFYQSHTGSPTNSLIFVLAGLLLSSGLGSYFSRSYSTKKAAWAFAGIVIFAAYHIFLGRNLLHRLGSSLLVENILISLTVVPLGFCMGIPFPFGIERVKRVFTEKQVPIFVAINSLASAFGITFGLYLSIALGFIGAAVVGVGSYAFALILFAVYTRRRTAAVP